MQKQLTKYLGRRVLYTPAGKRLLPLQLGIPFLTILSFRPRLVMLNEVSGFNWNFGFTDDYERWKYSRPELDVHYRRSVVPQYRVPSIKVAHMLVRKLYAKPEDFMTHIRYIANAAALHIAYGIEVEQDDDPRVDVSEIGSWGLEKSGDKNIVGIFPWLRHIPLKFALSLPGMQWRADAEKFKQWGFDLRDKPFDEIRPSLQSGTAPPSIAARMLDAERLKKNARWSDPRAREAFVRGMAGAINIGGSDTSANLNRFFVLAMVRFPQAQKRAHEELDRVIGSDRLPTFEDEPKLPYITAMVKELIRWTAPLIPPHTNDVDDVYDGYFIPKGSIVLANNWAILHDPETFPEPENFVPERFLKDDGTLNPDAPDVMRGFGYGRRICPGRYFALDFSWIVIASITSIFRFKTAIAADGSEIIPPIELRHGLLNYPKPFDCVIEPRSPSAEKLIQEL
ncbi:hypothetical protein PM082_004899 [Marasmius tenuissimus]|nr:hypothetical protein PM082_004899 [Marasmius tenuissimus]